MSRSVCFRLASLLVSLVWAFGAQSQPADEDLLWSSPDFEITVRDVKWYMKSPITADGEYLWEHPERVKRAITDLMTLRVLEVQADNAGVISEEEKQWIASYRVAMALVARHLSRQAMKMMESVDWEKAAMEYYLANREEFTLPEARTVRTFLLRLDSRTEEEAVALATVLAPKTLNQEAFRSVALENTEDPAAGDGLIENIIPGQTVQPFEVAIFSLTSVGEVSDPIVSQFGVHVAQLLAVTPERLQTFDEVRDEAEEKVKQQRWAEFNQYLRAEPQRNPPAGVEEITENVDSLLSFAAQRHSAAQEARMKELKNSQP